MSRMFPIIPVEVPDSIKDLIQKYCPLSQTEIVDDGDVEPLIYKFVGFIGQYKLKEFMFPKYKCHDFRIGVVSLYENATDNTCIFWHDNVLVIMISSTEEQHEGVMNHYGDAAILLTQIGNSHVIAPIISNGGGK